MLLPDTNSTDSFLLTKRMLHAVNKLGIPHKSSKAVDHVSISIGVASANGKERITKEQLIERADKALYKAKETGRNKATLSTKEECHEHDA